MNYSAFHHQRHPPQGADIGRRIALDRDEIGEQARADGADARLEVKEPRVDRRRRSERLERAHAVLDHQLELAHVVAVRVDADIAAEAHRHARIERGSEASALGRKARRLGVAALLPAAVLSDRVASGQRRTEADLAGDHQLPDLVGATVAVLDGLDAGLDCPAHPLGR